MKQLQEEALVWNFESSAVRSQDLMDESLLLCEKKLRGLSSYVRNLNIHRSGDTSNQSEDHRANPNENLK